MEKAKLFQYAMIWNPTDKQRKDDDKKPLIIVQPTNVLASDDKEVLMTAAMSIPQEYKDQLKQVDIIIRPF